MTGTGNRTPGFQDRCPDEEDGVRSVNPSVHYRRQTQSPLNHRIDPLGILVLLLFFLFCVGFLRWEPRKKCTQTSDDFDWIIPRAKGIVQCRGFR